MSHGIYKSIRQTSPGVFHIQVTDNNVYSIVNGRHIRDFKEYDNDYFHKQCPAYNKQQAEAAMLISGCCSGDEYYSQSWKNNQQLAFDYLRIKEQEYRSDFLNRHSLTENDLSDFHAIYNFNKMAKENNEEIYDSYEATYGYHNQSLVDGLIEYLKVHKEETKKKPIYIKFNGLYVCRLNKNGFSYSSSKKLLNLTDKQIEKVKRIMEHNEIQDYEVVPA